MKKLIDELNSFTENKYQFELKSALLKAGADFCVIEIFYKDGILLSKTEKDKVVDFSNQILPNNYKYEIKFIKKYANVDDLNHFIETYLKKNYSAVLYEIENIEINDKSIDIILKVDSLSYEHVVSAKLSLNLEKVLKKNYENYTFSLKIIEADLSTKFNNDNLKNASYFDDINIDIFEKRKIKLENLQMLIGEEFNGIADYIVDKTKVEQNIVVSGKILNIKEIIIKRKTNKAIQNSEDSEEAGETENQDENKYQRKMYRFMLKDYTGEIGCIFFSNKENQPIFEKVKNGDEIAIFGNIEADKYSQENVFVVKSIATCLLPENFVEYIEYKKEKPFYEYVEPEKIKIYVQDDLMSFADSKPVPENLRGKTYVCYDFETTGLHYESGDKIIEIGAVKIVDGKIVEKFMSYVNPEKHIPEESSAISGIVDSDVADAPTISNVLQDFYKFTRNAIIIGYNNINFDNVFLIGEGKKYRWNFDNEMDDVYRWAQKYVHGVKNYRLKTIADKLGVVLDNAHRAVFDALATAEVFIKISENL